MQGTFIQKFGLNWLDLGPQSQLLCQDHIDYMPPCTQNIFNRDAIMLRSELPFDLHQDLANTHKSKTRGNCCGLKDKTCWWINSLLFKEWHLNGYKEFYIAYRAKLWYKGAFSDEINDCNRTRITCRLLNTSIVIKKRSLNLVHMPWHGSVRFRRTSSAAIAIEAILHPLHTHVGLNPRSESLVCLSHCLQFFLLVHLGLRDVLLQVVNFLNEVVVHWVEHPLVRLVTAVG